MLHRRCLAGFELTSGSEYARDPNVLGFWKCIWFWYARVLNIPAFWICQSSEYKTGSEYNSILNIPGFWIYQGSLYISLVLTISGFWIYHGFWICQNSKYLRLLNIPGFWICIWLWIYQGFEFALVAQGSEYVWIRLNIFWIFFTFCTLTNVNRYLTSTEKYRLIICCCCCCCCCFFSISVFFHGHWRLTGQQGKGWDHFNYTLPLSPAHEHSDINLQLCMWDGYHIFLIAPLVFTRLLLDEI